MNLPSLLGINTAYASAVSPIASFVGRVNRYITNPLIVLMFAAALIYFLYGVFEFLMNSDQPDEREVGKSHMLWGIVGMFIMFAVGTILHIVIATLGVSPVNPNLPN